MVTSRTLARLLAAAAVLSTAGLGACGVRGALEPPPKATAAGTAASPEAADPGQGSVVKPKPHKDFILDGLIR